MQKTVAALLASFLSFPALAGAPLYVPSSGGDDAPMINAALIANCTVQLGSETYHQASIITIPQNCLLNGQGRSTKISKTANTDMIDLKYGASITNMVLDGDGDNFTGRGIVIRDGQHYQRIYNTHVNANGYAVEMEATDAGSHLEIENAFMSRYPNLSQYAIKLPDADSVTGGNRTIRNVRSSGGGGVDVAGAHNTMLDRVNMAYIHMGGTSITVQLINSRIGYAEWRGHSHWVTGNNVGVQNFITPDCHQSLFIWGPMNQTLGRQDPAANGNTVW